LLVSIPTKYHDLPDKQTGRICDRFVYPSVALLFLICTDHTRPISDLRKVFWWALERAKLPHMRIHDLRHSFATMATSIGEDIRVLKDVLGHTKITTTEIYAHTTNSAARQTANNVASAIMAA